MHQPTIKGLADERPVHTIFCIGRNYAKHAEELKSEIPDDPVVFTKPVTTIIEDGETVELPPQSNNIHHEVELVVAIGKTGRNIPDTEAMDHVAGYGLGIDVTARDIQFVAKDKSIPWTIAKGFDTFAPLSRFVPASEIADPQDLQIELQVNGETRQISSTSFMLFPVKTLVAYLSTIFTLHPGDLIFTGTPEGVSAIKEGDRIRATLNNDLISLSVAVQRK